MSAPARMTLSRAKGFQLQTASIALNGLAAVNVARPGAWGNPFIVGEIGREECLHRFGRLLDGLYSPPAYAPFEAQRAFVVHAADHWKSIKGKNLACWCPQGAGCHGDILLARANRCEAL
jgi:hypothetical protein